MLQAWGTAIRAERSADFSGLLLKCGTWNGGREVTSFTAVRNDWMTTRGLEGLHEAGVVVGRVAAGRWKREAPVVMLPNPRAKDARSLQDILRSQILWELHTDNGKDGLRRERRRTWMREDE